MLEEKSSNELVIIQIYWMFAHNYIYIVIANGPGDLGSVPGHVIPKTFKMVLDFSLLNIQQYKIRIKGKVEQSRGRIRVLPYPLVS